MVEPQSNRLFIDEYLSLSTPQRQREGLGDVILPFEEDLLKAELDKLADMAIDLATERASIASQSGDSWHDGALNESDRDKRFHDERVGKFTRALQARIIGYPESDETRVTLGSRVQLDNNGRSTVIEIVGFPNVHSETAGVNVTSMEAPIVAAVLGKAVGEIALLRTFNPARTIRVVEIDQESIRKKVAAYHGDTRNS